MSAERARREARLRRRFAIGMAVSAAAHAAVFALPGLEIPAFPDPREGRGRLAALRPPDRQAERPLEVVRLKIQPPGIASAGGPASTSPARAASAPAPRAPRADATPALTPPTPRARPAEIASARFDVAPVEARSAFALPATAGSPRRGVYEREEGEAGTEGWASYPGGGGGGAGARGRGTSGVTITGRGGDCITPGRSVPRTGTIGPAGRFPIGGPGRGNGGRYRP